MRICHICGKEDTTDVGVCKSCSKPFCSDCVSKIDDSVCTVCVSFTNTKIETTPLVGEDGVTHQGRKLVLTGEAWMRSRDVIAHMTDIELELKITALKVAVHEAELLLDYRRIHLNQAENEKEGRSLKHHRRRMLIEGVDAAHKANKVQGSNEKVDTAKDALKSLKNLGLNQTAIANVLLLLAKGKKK
jgi:hypothetical protein